VIAPRRRRWPATLGWPRWRIFDWRGAGSAGGGDGLTNTLRITLQLQNASEQPISPTWTRTADDMFGLGGMQDWPGVTPADLQTPGGMLMMLAELKDGWVFTVAALSFQAVGTTTVSGTLSGLGWTVNPPGDERSWFLATINWAGEPEAGALIRVGTNTTLTEVSRKS
jgi:hypothetical protein